ARSRQPGPVGGHRSRRAEHFSKEITDAHPGALPSRPPRAQGEGDLGGARKQNVVTGLYHVSQGNVNPAFASQAAGQSSSEQTQSLTGNSQQKRRRESVRRSTTGCKGQGISILAKPMSLRIKSRPGRWFLRTRGAS